MQCAILVSAAQTTCAIYPGSNPDREFPVEYFLLISGLSGLPGRVLAPATIPYSGVLLLQQLLATALVAMASTANMSLHLISPMIYIPQLPYKGI